MRGFNHFILFIAAMCLVWLLCGCSTYRYTTTDPSSGATVEFSAQSLLYSRTIKSARYESDDRKLRIDGSGGSSQMDQLVDLANILNEMR